MYEDGYIQYSQTESTSVNKTSICDFLHNIIDKYK